MEGRHYGTHVMLTSHSTTLVESYLESRLNYVHSGQIMHIHLEILTCLSQIHVEALIYTDKIPQMHVEIQAKSYTSRRKTRVQQKHTPTRRKDHV